MTGTSNHPNATIINSAAAVTVARDTGKKPNAEPPATNPPRESNWRNYPNTGRTYDSQHQRLRAQLIPRAIGKVCPFYHTDPQCPGLMLQHHRLALDHRVAVALGGTTTLDNVRITHHDCNQRAGSRLGAQQAQHKRNRYK